MTQKSIDYLEQSIKINPKFKLSHNELGSMYLSTGLTEKAIEEYEKALKIDPTFAIANFNLGLAYRKKHIFNKAWEQFRIAYKNDPTNLDILKYYGELLSQQGNFKDAIRVYESGVSLYPSDPNINYMLGFTFMKSGEKSKALKYFSIVYNLVSDEKQKEQIRKYIRSVQ
jgi:tetratricopeptide (TPR) repeat protein